MGESYTLEDLEEKGGGDPVPPAGKTGKDLDLGPITDDVSSVDGTTVGKADPGQPEADPILAAEGVEQDPSTE